MNAKSSGKFRGGWLRRDREGDDGEEGEDGEGLEERSVEGEGKAAQQSGGGGGLCRRRRLEDVGTRR